MSTAHLERTQASGPLPVVPLRHWGRWVSAVVVVVLFGGLLWSLGKNHNVEWPVVGEYLFKELTLRGLLATVELTLVAMAMGIVGGMVLAVMRLSGNPVLSSIAWAYAWFFRGTPQAVQLLFFGYLGALYYNVLLGPPFTAITWYSQQTSRLIGGFAAALLALGLNEAAYASEIVRAGILSVDEGQAEASQALGLTTMQSLRHVVLPQAMRVIIPPMGNETISMLKTTSLVVLVSGHELLSNLSDVYSQNFKVIPLLVVASIWYLALTTLLSIGQYFLERRFGRGTGRQSRMRAARSTPGEGLLAEDHR